MNLRRRLQNYIALNNYVEVFRSNILPDEYTQLEYIESSGTQYIDTGIKGNGTTKVDIKFKYHTTSSATGSGRVFGSRTTSSNNAFAIGTSSGIVSATGNKAFWCYDAQSFFVIDETFDLDVWKTVVFSATEHTLDGISYGDDYNVVEFETPQNLKLFGFDNNGVMGIGYVDIAYCKVWDNSILVRDFIPAKRNSDNVIGMFDLVSGQFFTNAAESGAFIAGSDASKTAYSNKVYLEDSIKDSLSSLNVYGKAIQSNIPEGYTQLEYLQNDGASYLLVPYRVNNKTVFYCRYNEIQKGPQTADAVFGVTDSPTTNIAYNGILRLIGGSFNRMGWGDNTIGSVIDVPTAPKEFNTWYEVLYDQNKLYQDGTLYATSATDPSTVWSANYDLGIFARNGSTVTMPVVAKISSIWAKEDGEYKINLVPAKRNSDNVLGMYDKVSGQFFTNQGTGNFTAGSEVVPTPTNPVDIYCSNGKLTISPNEANYISDNITIGYWIRNNNGQPEASPANFYTNMMLVKPDTNYICYGRRKDNSVISGYNRFAWYDATGTWIRNSTYTQGTIGSDVSPSNAAYVRFHCNIDGSNVTQELVDAYNWTVREGTIEEPFIPYGVIIDGTSEKLNIKGNNLYDITKDVNDKYIDANGNIGDDTSLRACYSDLIPVKEGKSYTYSGICKSSSGTSNAKRIHGYINGIWNQQIQILNIDINKTFSNTFTIPAGINGIRISHWKDDENTQVEECYRPTKYNNYLDMNLDVANLLSVSNYIDSQDILNGSIIRNVGIKVLDGTEDWTVSAAASNLFYSSSAITNADTSNSYKPISTHFNGVLGNTGYAAMQAGDFKHGSGNSTFYFKIPNITTVTECKQFFTNQYTAGTPVIVIYPLATPTTESVTSQITLLSSNNDVITRDSEYMDDLGLDLTYKKLR